MEFRTAVYETRMYGGVKGASHQLVLVGPSTQLDVVFLKLSFHSFTMSSGILGINKSVE